MRFIQVKDVSQKLNIHIGTNYLDGCTIPVIYGDLKEQLLCNLKSWSYGDVSVVCVPVNSTLEYSILVAIGSDEGFSIITLTRIASLCADLLRLIGIEGDSSTWSETWIPDINMTLENLICSQQIPIARQILNYLYLEMDKLSLWLITEAIPKNKFFTRDIEFDNLEKVILNIYKCYVHNPTTVNHLDIPGYAFAGLVDQIIDVTSYGLKQYCNNIPVAKVIDNFDLTKSDQFLIHILAYAISSTKQDSEIDNAEIINAESTLKDFGINKFNINTETNGLESLNIYCNHLNCEDGSLIAKTEALKLNTALSLLQNLNENLKNSNAISQSIPPMLLPCYKKKNSTTNDITIRCWIEDKDSKRMPGLLQLIHIAMPTHFKADWLDNKYIFEDGPDGCIIGMLYFPKENTEFYPWDEEQILNLKQSIRNLISWNQYIPYFTDHPHLKNYLNDAPGLLYFCCIDRTNNRIIYNNIKHVELLFRDIDITENRPNNSILSLHKLFICCISESHKVQYNGYKEGFWGNVGLVFNFKIILKLNNENNSDLDLALNTNSQSTFLNYPYKISDSISNGYLYELYALHSGLLSITQIEENCEIILNMLNL